jgi:hypothetical protein
MSFLVRWAAPHHSVAGSSSADVSTSESERDLRPEATRVRLLVRRICGCTVAKDRREALGELSQVEDCGVFMNPEHVRSLLLLLSPAPPHSSSSPPPASIADAEVQGRIVEILSNVTDSKIVTDDRTRDSFLKEIQTNGLSSLTRLLRDSSSGGHASGSDERELPGEGGGGSFWTKYRIAQILQRLLEHDTEGLQAGLLKCHGVAALADLLLDESNGGVLRNEGLALVSLLTASNAEIQTILAFDNGFDTLFGIVRKELQAGDGIIVVDCLAAILNMLRSNRASQKYFLETGAAKMLVPLLTDKVEALSGGGFASTASASVPSSRQSPLLPSDKKRFSAMDNSIVYSAVAILATLTRGGDQAGDGAGVRAALAYSGVVGPLACVALSQSRTLDDGTCAEAANVLVSILQGSKACCEQLLAVKLAVPSAMLLTGSVLADTPAPNSTAVTSATASWVCLWMCLEQRGGPQSRAAASSYQHAVKMQLTAFRLLSTLLAPSSGVAVAAASLLAKNLSPARSPGVGKHTPENHCGHLLSEFLFCRSNAAGTMMQRVASAAIVLDLILQVPQVQEQLLHIQWQTATVVVAGGDAVAPPPPSNLFNAYFRYAATLLSQSSTSANTTTTTINAAGDVAIVSSLLRPILTWLTYSGKTALMAIDDPFALQMYLQWPLQTKLAASAKLLCSTVAVTVLTSPQVNSFNNDKGTSTCSAEEVQRRKVLVAGLVSTFHESVGAQKWLDWLAEVSASTEWASAAAESSSSTAAPRPEMFLVFDRISVVSIKEAQKSLTTGGLLFAAPSHSAKPVLIAHEALSDVESDGEKKDDFADDNTKKSPQQQEHQNPLTPAASSSSSFSLAAAPRPRGSDADGDGGALPSELAIAEKNHWADGEVRRLLSANAAQQSELAQLKRQMSDMATAHHEAIRALEAQLAAANSAAASLSETLTLREAAMKAMAETNETKVAELAEALRQREEDAQSLVSTLGLLESRLAASTADAARCALLSQQLETVVGERDELLILVAELDEEREVLRNASAIVCPATNPPTDDDDDQ